jgi:hypothetical protein
MPKTQSLEAKQSSPQRMREIRILYIKKPFPCPKTLIQKLQLKKNKQRVKKTSLQSRTWSVISINSIEGLCESE